MFDKDDDRVRELERKIEDISVQVNDLKKEREELLGRIESLQNSVSESSARITILESNLEIEKSAVVAPILPKSVKRDNSNLIPQTDDPYPFMIFYDENGELQIYLPNGSCYYGSKEVEYPEGRDEANGLLALNGFSDEVWAVIIGSKEEEEESQDEEEEPPRKLEIRPEKGEPDESLMNILIADLKNEIQLVKGAVAFGAAGEAYWVNE